MKLYSQNENYKLYQGNMLDMLEVIEPNSIDSIVTDPPYELNFMGKGWDNAGVSFDKDTWKKCFEVLKPGGYLLAFGGSRTYHRIACAIEDAGFEIRDTIMWLYGSGFPKSMALDKAIEGKLILGNANTQVFRKLNGELVDRGNYGYASVAERQGARPSDYNLLEEQRLGKLNPTTELAKKWQGWGTALKPSFEPIIVARKPFKGSLVDNVIENGVGGLNIDECRVELNGDKKTTGGCKTSQGNISHMAWKKNGSTKEDNSVGRFPANTILTYDENDFDEVCGGFPYTKTGSRKAQPQKPESWNAVGIKFKMTYACEGSEGSASRYFYCAKASKKDRDEGCIELEDGLLRRMRPDKDDNNPTGLNKEGRFAPIVRKNTHPTVKPTELMQYLIRLVSPNGATILDPFNGSGSTGKAVMYENKERNKNYKYIGIELTEEYLPIAKARIEYASKKREELKDDEQLTIYDLN